MTNGITYNEFGTEARQEIMTDSAQDVANLAQIISERGWLRIHAPLNGEKLGDRILNLAHALGKPCLGRNGQAVETLAPTEKHDANRHSLSGEHGTAAFPLHVDGAHIPEPPRFLILACEYPGTMSAPTVLAPFEKLNLTADERERCQTIPFIVNNGSRSFYSTILSESRPFVRFDPGCMKAVSTAALDLAKTITDSIATFELTTIHWNAGDILIIDNWRVLHGRGLANTTASTDRRLIRVTIQ